MGRPAAGPEGRVWRLLTAKADAAPQLAFCWAHVRRKFYDIHVANASPLAEQSRRIAELYAIEDDIRGTPAEHRRAERRQHSRPLVEALHDRLTEQLERVSGRSALARAMRYALNHWNGLILYLDDGRLEMDTNTVERATDRRRQGGASVYSGSFQVLSFTAAIEW